MTKTALFCFSPTTAAAAMLPPLDALPTAAKIKHIVREFAAETGAVTEEFEDAAAEYVGRFLESMEEEEDLEELHEHAEAILELVHTHHERVAEEAEEFIAPLRDKIEEDEDTTVLDVILTDEIRSAL